MHLGQLYSDRAVSVGRLKFHQIVTVFPVELPGSVMTWGDDDESNRSQSG